ncbi:thermonuclease family protein (plasmid) [Streptosporangium sandarakinum]|uniref:thermonuclease family protein n=1 Tax=Streptosporangium sandarakinum TaxID=1260955 RepID=UPI003D94C7E4
MSTTAIGGGAADAAPPSPLDVGVHRLEVMHLNRAGVTGVLDFGFGVTAAMLLNVAVPGRPGIGPVRQWVAEHGNVVFVRPDPGRRRGRRAATLVEAPAPSYAYQAGQVRVVDGDTLDVDLGLPYGLQLAVKLRLAGVNTPELATAPGAAAAAWVRDWVATRRGGIVVRTVKDRREKYGRYLAVVEAGGVSLNQELVAAGVAAPYDGGRR